MAFMELVATLAIPVRVEPRILPKLFQVGPGLVSEGSVGLVSNRFHNETHTRAIGERRLPIRLKNAVLESGLNHIDHG
jgi:hypothetical protein